MEDGLLNIGICLLFLFIEGFKVTNQNKPFSVFHALFYLLHKIVTIAKDHLN